MKRLLADPSVSARVHAATGGAVPTLTANGVLDSQGAYESPRLTEAVRLAPTAAVQVRREDAENLRARLQGRALSFEEAALPGTVLFRAFAPTVPHLPCRHAPWRLAPPDAMDPAGRVVEVSLPRPASLVGLYLEHPGVAVTRLPLPGLSVSDDGQTWRAVPGVRRLDTWHWAGLMLFHATTEAEELLLPPTRASHARVALALPGPEGRQVVTRLCVRTA